MRRIAIILSGSVLCFAGHKLMAQQKGKSVAAASAAKGAVASPARKLFFPLVYMGAGSFCGGPVQKDMLNKYLGQGLEGRDSLGNRYKVIGFDFTYAEKNIYEDSTGYPMVVMDYTNEPVKGNVPGTDILQVVGDKLKPGDTVFFDHIRVVRYTSANETVPESAAIMGKGFKCFVIK